MFHILDFYLQNHQIIIFIIIILLFKLKFIDSGNVLSQQMYYFLTYILLKHFLMLKTSFQILFFHFFISHIIIMISIYLFKILRFKALGF
jgi:hypothetical protein